MLSATAPTTYTITPSAGANGSISPSVATSVNSGASQIFTITANSGYHVSDVLVDSVSVDAVSSYEFTNVTANHTISATFAITSSGGGGMPAGWGNQPTTPAGGFKITVNQGVNKTSNRIVNLKFNAGGSNVAKMAISLTGDFSDANQENYSPTKEIDLCSKFGGLIKKSTCPDGEYTVYVKFYTQYGVPSDIIQTKINLVSVLQFSKDLKLGSADSQIKLLQQFLNQNGYVLADNGVGSPGNETNFFGALTSNALVKFQEVNKDKVVGIIKEKGFLGPITRQYINSLTGITSSTTPAQQTQNPSAIFITPLYKGLQSEDARRLQILLATKAEIYPEGKITGYFGPLTEKAVQTFQLNYGVVTSSSDPGFGYVGPKTRGKLQEVFGNK